MRDLIDDCVHCGFCLPTCPMYQLWDEEMDSPRGRIVLMGEHENTATLSDAMITHFDRCLGCMACVTACPSGGHAGHAPEAAVEVGDHGVRERGRVLVLAHEDDAPARRVHLLIPELVRRARGQAEPAVDAVVDQVAHQMPPT